MLPLADVRVLAVEQFGAGPWATLQLADLGAEIIKVEHPRTGGDIARHIPPYCGGGDSLYFEAFNRGKRSISLDLKHEDGRAAFERLAARADAVFCNVRGDLPAALGLTYTALRHVNPRIVCCSLTGFGTTGPRRSQVAYDAVIQAMAGWMWLTGEPDGPPARSGLSLVDFAGGYVAAFSLLAGVHQARRDGTGCDCDVALFDAALAQLNYIATWAASRDHQPKRLAHSAHPSIVPFQAFEASDGWLTVACAKDVFWERLCAATRREDLLADPRYSGMEERRMHRRALTAELAATFASRPVSDWLAALERHGVPAGRVNSVAEAMRDPQTQHRSMIVQYDHPTLGMVRQIAPAARTGDRARPVSRAPFRGEDTDDVLETLGGYTTDEIAALRGGGATGDRDAGRAR